MKNLKEFDPLELRLSHCEDDLTENKRREREGRG